MAPKAGRSKGSNAGRHRPTPWRKSRSAPISEPSALAGPRASSSGGPSKSALGSYLADISRSCPLAPNEEAELALRIRRGDQKALHRLITANLRFVVSVARNYQHQGVPLEDLVNEGNIGLIRAARKFDEKKNFKFISYAVWWVRQAILQALARQSRLYKVPINRVGTVYTVGKHEERLIQRYRRHPTGEEVARASGLSIGDVEAAQVIRAPHSSLDEPVGLGRGIALAEVLEDTEGERPDDHLAEESSRDEVYRLLGELPERERDIVCLYFGLDGEGGRTLDEIGSRLGLTRERVRQLRDRSLKKLREELRES